MVTLEVQGRAVRISREQVERARILADGEAGRSSPLRDLALVLALALSAQRVIVLRRSEARALLRLAVGDPLLAELAAALRPAGDAAAA
jgi:hypothetical protein